MHDFNSNKILMSVPEIEKELKELIFNEDIWNNISR